MTTAIATTNYLKPSAVFSPVEPSDLIPLVLEAQEKKLFLVVFCHCEITYSGRAEAFLPRGDRCLLLKQDGVLLIHQPENGNPINYLKAGGTVSLDRLDDHIVMHARSVDGKEFLTIEIFRVHDAMLHRLEDGQQQELAGTERDMSDMIRDNPSLISPDFRPISREEQTDVGFIDVFGHDGQGNLVVVECKRYSASLACVTQLRRYVEKVSQIKGTPNVKGVMAAPAVTPNAFELLKEWGFSWARVEAPKRLERHKQGQKRLGEY